jgi:acyl carrier protein
MSDARFDAAFDEVLQDILGWDVVYGEDDGPRTLEVRDSLTQVRLIHAIEDRFGAQMPDDALLGEHTVGSLRALTRQHAGSEG